MLSPQILHKHCFQFVLRLAIVPRETENNTYAKFLKKTMGIMVSLHSVKYTVRQELLHDRD